MISPGCSFKFDGLKQTMLAVHPGIESKIKSVVKLEKNYRVTKDVLVVSNSILAEAKKYFKGSIEYARPEKAVKDLGTRVFWCHWDEALLESPRFGVNQALIYTSYDPESIFVEMNKWLNEHPFILTTLDSKGLEFEDVVVAFDLDRKAWAVKEKRVSSLRLLRELYVAVTRAKRRVVILIKRNVETMREFFLSLEGCNIVETDAKTAFLEFDSNTSSDEWFDLGMQRFEVWLYFLQKITKWLTLLSPLNIHWLGRELQDGCGLFQSS
jgi:superfamily I DNA/RNA helicase